ncbi:hypothetical protein BGZ59_008737 [Podila verticillata]|nr:hypothetical protein BGZ59_008737 [Podila verticillata]
MSILDILQKIDRTPRQPLLLSLLSPPQENAASILRLEKSQQPSTPLPISAAKLLEQVVGATMAIPHRTITPMETSVALRTAMTECEDIQDHLSHSTLYFSDPDPDLGFEELGLTAATSLDEPYLQEPNANMQEPDQGYVQHEYGVAPVDTVVMTVRPIPTRGRHRDTATFDGVFAAFNMSRHEEEAHRAREESISYRADRAVSGFRKDEFGRTRIGETDVPRSAISGEEGPSSIGVDQSFRHFERSSFRRVDQQAKRSIPDFAEEYWRDPSRRRHSTDFSHGDTTPTHPPPVLDKAELKRSLAEDDYTQILPYTFIHTDRYLELVTESDPLVTIRLVFLSSQLPRSANFTKLILPIRNKHLIDTFLIPHETIPTHPDADVVLGFSGALTRVLQGLQEFLQELAPTPPSKRFYMWRLCVLIPHRIHFLFIGEQDHDLVYDEENDMAESSIPQLRRVLGRRYGPVSEEAQDEHILTLESVALDRIMTALRFVAETTKMHSGLPVGYLVRSEMALCQRRMQQRPYHCQILLTLMQASYVIGKGGERIWALQESTNAVLELSRNVKSAVRVCDVGGYDVETVIKAVGTVVEAMFCSGVLAAWEVKVYVPQRVARVLGMEETRRELAGEEVEVEILTLEKAEQRVRDEVVRLEEEEVEVVARFRSAIGEQTGIRAAVRRTMGIMYGDAEE